MLPLAFGVPGSVSMTILLGALMMNGLVPGPEMLGKNLDVTYSIIWSVALANIFAVAILLMLSKYFAKLALIRAGILVPAVLSVVFVGAFEIIKPARIIKIVRLKFSLVNGFKKRCRGCVTL